MKMMNGNMMTLMAFWIEAVVMILVVILIPDSQSSHSNTMPGGHPDLTGNGHHNHPHVNFMASPAHMNGHQRRGTQLSIMTATTTAQSFVTAADDIPGSPSSTRGVHHGSRKPSMAKSQYTYNEPEFEVNAELAGQSYPAQHRRHTGSAPSSPQSVHHPIMEDYPPSPTSYFTAFDNEGDDDHQQHHLSQHTSYPGRRGHNRNGHRQGLQANGDRKHHPMDDHRHPSYRNNKNAATSNLGVTTGLHRS